MKNKKPEFINSCFPTSTKLMETHPNSLDCWMCELGQGWHMLLFLSQSHKQLLIKKPAWEWKRFTVNPTLCIPKQNSTKYRASDIVMTLQGPMFQLIFSVHDGPMLQVTTLFAAKQSSNVDTLNSYVFHSKSQTKPDKTWLKRAEYGGVLGIGNRRLSSQEKWEHHSFQKMAKNSMYSSSSEETL